MHVDATDRSPATSRVGGGVVSWPLVLFVVVAVVHLVQLLLELPTSGITHVLLVPPLIAHLLLRTQGRHTPLVRWSAVALGFGWLGDAVPVLLPAPAQLAGSILLHALAHVGWIAAFLPTWRRSIASERPPLLVPYAIGVVGLIGVCLPGSGGLWPFVVLYGMLLVTMPVLATGIGIRATWGGVGYVLASGLIAWRAFLPGFQLPADDAIIVALYLVALVLLVSGVVHRVENSSRGVQPAR
ncbi:lysoplasmalogenase family protein [Desertihabitans aurantiacus]|uniref:lysoplasmalogenase family protein n=1 Tax=Desertihabitans aurantiacus TaxID=2282477 RepID=UPI0013002675|nr:lysoplasmalogenase family protein [Desertihabitans aurantiacus]